MDQELASGLAFREVQEADIDVALDHAFMVFNEKPPGAARLERHREVLRGSLRIGAYDGPLLVGLLAALPFTLSVPGGDVPCSGVSFVTVSPTHRRRGVLTGMMAELFRRSADRPLAALWASEAAIYGRYGYGYGTYAATVEIDSRRPLALRIAPDERPVRLLGKEETVKLLGPYYDATRASRPGRPARDEAMWREEWLVDTDEGDDDLTAPRVVALGDPVAGYAVYRTKCGDEDARTPGLVRVDELEADTPAVAAALWRYLAGIDLTGVVRAWGRPEDDPLPLMAADRDQVRVTSRFPAMWLRLVDVRDAMERRAWAAPVDLVLEVRDDRLPANAGVRRLVADGGSCSFRPEESAAPDLTFDVRDLATCYLGGTRAEHLVRAGLVAEHTPGAAAALDAALATELLPHTSEEF
ncbi:MULTISPECIES: GNAT family N-acetyltransferase [Actinomadura]|uniref:GNAT family N-acetyltransferase n=1 Tax=Actinomadura yumaensis TaxID=111807 RepID=A0ABW2CIQ3_9ACTN|nr:GNAT family N-acetyltransferase [Actinomadura sp. J1-007]MWK40658.1 GNAT family N-acetyltransferase [Actinomadura sp. J1-007]